MYSGELELKEGAIEEENVKLSFFPFWTSSQAEKKKREKAVTLNGI